MKQNEHLALLEDKISDLIKHLEDMKISIKINKGWNIGGAIEKKPIWETHPDWDSCKTERTRFWHASDGEVLNNNLSNRVNCISFAHAKRQVAEIKLMEIAEKWNEGVEIELYQRWYVRYTKEDNELLLSEIDTADTDNFGIYFNNYDLGIKSIELHKELWEQYFMI